MSRKQKPITRVELMEFMERCWAEQGLNSSQYADEKAAFCGGLNKGWKYPNWKPISTAPKDTPVLVACRSGYVTHDWEYRLAYFSEGYHNRWDTLGGNDALTDYGLVPEYWTEVPGPPERPKT